MDKIKHLYIIGNGFDIFSGLKTKYINFAGWLQYRYPFIYDELFAIYDVEAEWWKDFEQQLGFLDVDKFVKKYSYCNTNDKIISESEEEKNFEKKHKLPPSLVFDSKCANRLKGLLDELQYCFEKWVDYCMNSLIIPRYIKLETKSSYFINFNYTDVIECLYQIPEDRVLHIHGRASKREHLVFGHNNHLYDVRGADYKKVCDVLNGYEKNPYDYICKNNYLSDLLKNVENVHIYGFSFSPVDEDYIDWIYKKTSENCLWEISWFSDNDKERIEQLMRWKLKNRLKLIRLDELEVKKYSILGSADFATNPFI